MAQAQIMRMWPFREILIKSSKSSKAHSARGKMPVRLVHYFGEDRAVSDILGMTNHLTGYVFVVDQDGRIRWRSAGKLTEAEGQSMLQAVRGLLPAQERDAYEDVGTP
jgi:mitochondrial ATPase complex subunit ATP10